MTESEYKRLVPEHAHLTGNPLWDAMTLYALDHPEKFPPLTDEELQKINESKQDNPYPNMGIVFPEGHSGKLQIEWKNDTPNQ